MQGATFALLANVAIAALFAGSFAILAVASRRHRATIWLSASYATGALTPLSEFLLPRSDWPNVFVVTSFASLSAALLLMAVALSSFYGRRTPWLLLIGIFAASLATRVAIWDVPRNSLLFSYGYQFPFAIAASVSAWIVFRASARRALDLLLGSLLTALAVHFLLKPLVALAVGEGQTARDYATSLYALFSQAGTGVLLIANGLTTLLIVSQAALADALRASETDVLSGLLNRRGFDLQAEKLLADGRRLSQSSAVMLMDIDRFKSINDTFGHATGDAVIANFAAILRRLAPPGGIVGRVGGEEFAILIPGATVAMAHLLAGSVRACLLAGNPVLPSYTISAGLSAAHGTDELSKAMRRADAALYAAKATGRDRICTADGDARPVRKSA